MQTTLAVRPARQAPLVLSFAMSITLASLPALAQVAPSLGTAGTFVVLGGSTVTNTGPTILTGDLGLSPGSAVTGFPPGLVAGGTTHVADAEALGAQADVTTAYNQLTGQPCTNSFAVPTDLGGLTLVPGVYCFASSVALTGTLTLNALGNPASVWVFKVGSTLITASNASVVPINGGQPCNVFWQVGSSATVGTGSTFVGNILALTSITLTTNAAVSGRALARNGAVTLDTNTVSTASCSVTPPLVAPPTLAKVFSPASVDLGATSTLTITLGNSNPAPAALGASLVDDLPWGLTLASEPVTTCGGTVTGALGGSQLTLSGGVIPANGSCTVSALVTAAATGSFENVLAGGALQTTAGNNTLPAVAILLVNTPAAVAPTLAKTFSPQDVLPGALSTLTITLSNAGDIDATLTAPLVDALPWGLVFAGAPTTTCGGTVTTNPLDATLTLAGGVIPAHGACAVSVDVTAECAGSYLNTIPVGALQTTNGYNAAPAEATLTARAGPCVAPRLEKSFAPSNIMAGGVSTLTITLTNPTVLLDTLTVPLVDLLPSGLVVVAASTPTNTCGGTVTINNAATSVTLAGGTIPSNGNCTVVVEVTGTCGGEFINHLAAGALQTTNGHNLRAAQATLTVTPEGGGCTSNACPRQCTSSSSSGVDSRGSSNGSTGQASSSAASMAGTSMTAPSTSTPATSHAASTASSAGSSATTFVASSGATSIGNATTGAPTSQGTSAASGSAGNPASFPGASGAMGSSGAFPQHGSSSSDPTGTEDDKGCNCDAGSNTMPTATPWFVLFGALMLAARKTRRVR